MKIKYPLENPHQYTVEELTQFFQTNTTAGISQAEADTRNKEIGLNSYETHKQKSLGILFLLQFKSPIVYLLVFAVLITFYFQNTIEAIAILIVIFINAIIGFLMELQARRSMNALKQMDKSHSRVIRNGKTQEILSDKITIGDIVLLEAGDIIPGDGRLIECNQLQCDESTLTGESLPTEKNTEKLPAQTALGDQINMVFKGTSIINGNGKAIITGIAKNTELGIITSLVENEEEKETPLDIKINSLSKKLIWITLVMTFVFALTGFIQGKEWLLILETSIALAVAAFPEGLPIVATVALAYGMVLMAKRNAIVKNLSSVETLGSTNIILTDKTGTLTENKIYVDTLSFPENILKVKIENNILKIEKGDIENNKNSFQKLRLIGTLCNNATVHESKHLGDPIEIALLLLANASGDDTSELKSKYERIDEIPFNSNTKIMGTIHKNANGIMVMAKGSVEHLLKKCTRIQLDSTQKEMIVDEKKKILSESDRMAADGLRVLAFAYKEEINSNDKDFLNELVYVGMIGFIDPPRLDIKEAILSCRKAGIKIVMITGDHPLTALNIAKKVGLVDETETTVLKGSELPPLESISEEWNKKILSTSIIARATPKQKLDIVALYQKEGNIVAMTGDGVNDAPALKKSDIGIAMGLRGTQVAKETASIILKDDSFISIAKAVSHGRQIFQNIQKFVIYLVSCNLSEIFIVTTLGFIAPTSTLLPLQILFLNMVTDVFPALALGLGRGDQTVMDGPPRDPKKDIITNKNWVATGLYSATITLAVIVAVLYCKFILLSSDKTANNIAFMTLAFAQLFHVFNMSSPHSNIIVNDITKNKFIWLALLICSILIITVYAIPQMRLVLGLELVSIRIWIVSLLASLIPLFLVQGYKIIAEKRSK